MGVKLCGKSKKKGGVKNCGKRGNGVRFRSGMGELG